MEINSKRLDELYKEWSAEHHTTNSNKPVHDSSECIDFAKYCLKYAIEDKTTNNLTAEKLINGIENLMQRWHLSRDNDDETLNAINDLMVTHGRLQWENGKN